MKNKYATQRVEALRTPATPSKDILHIDRLPPGTPVVLLGRASTQTNRQEKSPEDQIKNLKHELEKRSFKIIDDVPEFAARDAEYEHRSKLERALLIAEKHNAVVVAESMDRFIGCFGYRKRRNPAPLDVFSIRRLLEMAVGVRLATLLHPDAMPDRGAVKAYQTKRGQAANGNSGGRPVEQFPKKARRVKLMPQAIDLWKAGRSYRKIGRQLKIHWSTVRDWIQCFKKSAHLAEQSKTTKSLVNTGKS